MHSLSILIFVCIYFCELKKNVFLEYSFFANSKFLKILNYKFQPHRKKNKKKTVPSRDMWLIFLSRSMERQAGHDGKTDVID